MKRGWIGAGLLAVILAVGLLVTWCMDRFHDPVAGNLEQAAERALHGDWETADLLTQRAQADWEAHWDFSAAFADHEPMETIDGLFAQVEVYRRAEDRVAFAAACAELSRKVEAMGEAHSVAWRNIF